MRRCRLLLAAAACLALILAPLPAAAERRAERKTTTARQKSKAQAKRKASKRRTSSKKNAGRNKVPASTPVPAPSAAPSPESEPYAPPRPAPTCAETPYEAPAWPPAASPEPESSPTWAPTPYPSPTWAPTAYPSPTWTPTPYPSPSSSPDPVSSPDPSPSLPDIFQPLVVHVPLLGHDPWELDSYFTCDVDALTAGAYVCGNVSGVSFTANCTANPDGVQACVAAVTEDSWIQAYFDYDMAMLSGSVHDLLFKFCHESGSTSCDITGDWFNFHMLNDRFSAACNGATGPVDWSFSCAGDFGGTVTGSGTLEINFELPASLPGGYTAEGYVKFEPVWSGSIGMEKDFEFSCPVTGGVDLYCPKLNCCGFLEFGAPAECLEDGWIQMGCEWKY